MIKPLQCIVAPACAGLLMIWAMVSTFAENAAQRPRVGSENAVPRVNTQLDPLQVPTTGVLPDPALPVRQAREIGLNQCAPMLEHMSHDALTTPYDVQAGWSRVDPTHHIFQSVAALRNTKNNPPDGLAALIAAPLGADGCDGVLVQVFPLAGDCQSAQKVMLQSGKSIGPMLGTRIMLDANGHRVILLPAFANTCVAISVDTRFGEISGMPTTKQ